VTLIVTVLHCTSLQEITSAEQLLNWGFAMNGRVRPVGMLVPPLAPATHPASRGDADKAADALAITPEPGPLGTAGLAIGGVAIAALGLGGLAVMRRRAAVAHAGHPVASAPAAESVTDTPATDASVADSAADDPLADSAADDPLADSAADAPRADSVDG
jgi:hypothetical protein